MLKNLRSVLAQRGLTQKELSERTGIGLATIGTYVSGKGNPTIKHVLNICDVLGVDLQTLLSGDPSVDIQVSKEEANVIEAYRCLAPADRVVVDAKLFRALMSARELKARQPREEKKILDPHVRSIEMSDLQVELTKLTNRIAPLKGSDLSQNEAHELEYLLRRLSVLEDNVNKVRIEYESRVTDLTTKFESLKNSERSLRKRATQLRESRPRSDDDTAELEKLKKEIDDISQEKSVALGELESMKGPSTKSETTP